MTQNYFNLYDWLTASETYIRSLPIEHKFNVNTVTVTIFNITYIAYIVGRLLMNEKEEEEEGERGMHQTDTEWRSAVIPSWLLPFIECSIFYLKWSKLWSILCCQCKGFHMLIPFIETKAVCLKEVLWQSTLQFPAAAMVIEPKGPNGSSVSLRILSSRLRKHL